MLNRLRAMRRDEGFTLIELLIVIVILGVLAAVVVFSVSGITDRGDVAACKADVATTRVAVEAYYAKHGTYPASIDALTTAPDIFLQSAPTKATYDGTTHVVTGVGCTL